MIQVFDGDGVMPCNRLAIGCQYATRTGPFSYIPTGEVRYSVMFSTAGSAHAQKDTLKSYMSEPYYIDFVYETNMAPSYLRDNDPTKQSHLVKESVRGMIWRVRARRERACVGAQRPAWTHQEGGD